MGMRIKVARPPDSKLYHGVYPGKIKGVGDDITQEDLKEYMQAVGRKVALVYFSNEWGRPNGQEFPCVKARWISDLDMVPFIRLMLRSSTECAKKTPEKEYTLDRILKGNFEKPLKAWAHDAFVHGRPLLVEYGTECNGYWMPWNAQYAEPDGAKKFQEVYRYIVKCMAEATNITWVFHVDADDNPPDNWNHLCKYYPGPEVVDWIAVSCYGAQLPNQTWHPEGFAVRMNRVYPRLQAMAPDIPIFIAEFGCVEHNPEVDPRTWADAALMDIFNQSQAKGKWPNLIGFSWWNSYWDNDDEPMHDSNMLVQKIEGLPEIFQKRLSNPRVQTSPVVSEK